MVLRPSRIDPPSADQFLAAADRGAMPSRSRCVRAVLIGIQKAIDSTPIDITAITSGQADSPKAYQTTAPTTAAEACWTKPTREQAAPAQSGYGVTAPAMADGIASIIPV